MSFPCPLPLVSIFGERAITLNAAYSGAVDYVLQVRRPGAGASVDGIDAHDLSDLGMYRADRERNPEVAELLCRAASGGIASPAPMTTNDVQMFLAWKGSLKPDHRAIVDGALSLLRADDFYADEDCCDAETPPGFVMRWPVEGEESDDAENPNVVRVPPRVWDN